MKPTIVVPVLTLLAGFAGGWLAKPAPEPATVVVAGTATRPPIRTHPPGPPGDLPPPPHGDRPPDDRPPPPGDPGAAPPPVSRDEAKLLRVVEALDLSESQQTDLQEILAKARRAYTGGDPAQAISAKDTLAQVTAASAALEASLTKLLTPEQAAKFADLRQRERDNRIEAKTHRELDKLAEITDLSPAQRDRIAAQLRQDGLAELNEMPASLSLVLDSSVLPLGPHAMPEQSLVVLRQVADADSTAGPEAGYAKLIAEQRRLNDARLNWLKAILTPAQLAQYQASVAEQRAIRDQMAQPRR